LKEADKIGKDYEKMVMLAQLAYCCRLMKDHKQALIYAKQLL